MADSKPLAAPLSGPASIIVGTIGGIALASAAFIPAPWNGIVGWVGFIAAILAGMAAHPPEPFVGKPVLQGVALTVASTAMGLLSQFYLVIPAGWPQSVALGVAGILAWLTGKSLPALGAVSPTAEQVAAADAGTTAAAAVDTKSKALDVLANGAKGPPAP